MSSDFSKSPFRFLSSKFIEWAIVVCLFGGIAYATTTVWRLDSQMPSISDDLGKIKRSLVTIILQEEPDRSALIEGLVSNDTYRGFEVLTNGDIQLAYEIWSDAAERGDDDSILAIYLTRQYLQSLLDDQQVDSSTSQEISRALEAAPRVDVIDGSLRLAEKKE